MSVEELREREKALLEKAQKGERQLFDPGALLHREGEVWWRNLGKYRGWIEQLKQVRVELRAAGEIVEICDRCGSLAPIGGMLYGCEDCRLGVAEDRLHDALAGRGWAFGELSGERIAITRGADTVVSGPALALPRVQIRELVALAMMPSVARGSVLDIKRVFANAQLESVL